MHKFEITKTNGERVTRRTENAYVAASEKQNGRVSFHLTRDAAVKAAGSFGTVHDLPHVETSDKPRFNRWTIGFTDGGSIEIEVPHGMMPLRVARTAYPDRPFNRLARVKEND